MKVSSKVEEDSFFNELMKPDPSPKKGTSVSANKNENNSNITNDNNVDENDWDVDGWAVSDVQTPTFNSVPLKSSTNGTSCNDQRSELQELTKTIMEELREYMLNFADPRATSELNEDLNEKPFSALMAYYGMRPDLATYTIEHEG